MPFLKKYIFHALTAQDFNLKQQIGNIQDYMTIGIQCIQKCYMIATMKLKSIDDEFIVCIIIENV